LSHGSIVAREYGIPAVLGTGVATRRISSGQTIRVDGDAGTVRLLDGTEAGPREPESERRNLLSHRNAALVVLGAAVAAIMWWKRRS
jgi:phosphoenolpyruvate-protein kinase (PTS system EI component)